MTSKSITAARVLPGDTITTPDGDTLTVTGGGWTNVDRFGNWITAEGEPTHVYLDSTEEDRSVLLPVAETVTLVSRPAAPLPTPRPGEQLQVVTVGWTKHEARLGDDGHVPFWDVWKPGRPQHEETVTVALPAELSGQQVADAVFHATNAPEVREGTPEHAILAALKHTGYEGREAHWSLSVGDTVTVDGVIWAVDRFGWVHAGKAVWVVETTYNTDPEGNPVPDEDWSNTTLHGPFPALGAAQHFMEDVWPDGDTDVKEQVAYEVRDTTGLTLNDPGSVTA
jgi:hypothetical protein